MIMRRSPAPRPSLTATRPGLTAIRPGLTATFPGRAGSMLAVAAALLALAPARGPAAALAAQDLTFEDYEPRSTLVVPETRVTRAAVPFIDVHSHHRNVSPERLAEVVAAMDRLNMRALVNLSGGSGEELAARVRATEAAYPGRFLTFANVDFRGIDQPGWGDRAARQLEEDVRVHGAAGLKIFKNLGMDVRDGSGRRVPTNDPRLDPVWAKAGELGVPVLIHTGDPAEFFEPHDRFNERWLELKQFPNRARPAASNPSWERVMAEQHDVFRKHPGTTFINAHLGWMGHDLGRLARLLDDHPNVLTEVAAAIAELGRQPRAARDFLVRYQDRVLFGKDTFAEDEYHTYFRLFQTADEYFPYFRRRHAFWRMYGLDLPQEVVRKLYHDNAARVLGLAPGG